MSGSNLRPGETAASVAASEFGAVPLPKANPTDREQTVYEDLLGFGVLPRFAAELSRGLEDPNVSMFSKWARAWAVLSPRMGPATLTEWMRRHKYWVHGAETPSKRGAVAAQIHVMRTNDTPPRCERCRDELPGGTPARLSERMDGGTILTCVECTPD